MLLDGPIDVAEVKGGIGRIVGLWLDFGEGGVGAGHRLNVGHDVKGKFEGVAC